MVNEIPQEVMDETAAENLDGVLEAIRDGTVKKDAFPQVREMLYTTRSRFEEAIEKMKELIERIDQIDKEIAKREVS